MTSCEWASLAYSVRALPVRGASTGEAGHGQIEATQYRCTGLDFPLNGSRTPGVPESYRHFWQWTSNGRRIPVAFATEGVLGAIPVVEVERRGVYGDVPIRGSGNRRRASVELRDREVIEANAKLPPLARRDNQPVILEVEARSRT